MTWNWSGPELDNFHFQPINELTRDCPYRFLKMTLFLVMTYEVSHDSKAYFVSDVIILESTSVSIILMDFLGYTAPWSLGSRLDSTMEPRLKARQLQEA